MNVRSDGVMPSIDEAPTPLGIQTMIELMTQRLERFQAFARVEVSRGGFVQPSASLSTTEGQEMYRILVERTIEEVGESLESSDPDHIKEEIADAVNFLTAALMLDPTVFTPQTLAEQVWSPVLKSMTRNWRDEPIDWMRLGMISYQLTTVVGDLLRNRPWSQNAQDLYFTGQTVMAEVARVAFCCMLPVFSSEAEFWQFYVAKDRVLEFRLQTAY